MKNKVTRLIAFMLVLSLICAYMPMKTMQTAEAASKPKLSKKTVTLKVNQSVKLKVKNTKKKVKWSSKNKKIATVTSKGKVTAKKKGTTYIVAKVGKKKLKCKVIVKKKNKSNNNTTEDNYSDTTQKKYNLLRR